MSKMKIIVENWNKYLLKEVEESEATCLGKKR